MLKRKISLLIYNIIHQISDLSSKSYKKVILYKLRLYTGYLKGLLNI